MFWSWCQWTTTEVELDGISKFGCLHIDACVGAIYVSDEFWLQRVPACTLIGSSRMRPLRSGTIPISKSCVQNVLRRGRTRQFAKFQTRSGRMSSIAVLTTHSAPDPEQVRTDAPADNGPSAIHGSSIENSGIDVTRR